MRTLFSCLLMFWSAAAIADDMTDPSGQIDSLEVYTVSADRYVQYHGAVVIHSAGGDISGPMYVQYRWGGTSCGSRVLNADQVELLQRAQINGLEVTPHFRNGAGATKCLVGVTLR